MLSYSFEHLQNSFLMMIIKNVWLSEIEFLMAGSSEWLVSDGERRDEVVLALQLCDHFLLMPVYE